MAYKKKARKMSKFERSQAAHERLVEKHEKNQESEKSRRLMSYHVDVYNTQLSRGRILSREEKRAKYKGWVKP